MTRIPRVIRFNPNPEPSRILLVHRMLSGADEGAKEDFVKGITNDDTDDTLLKEIYREEEEKPLLRRSYLPGQLIGREEKADSSPGSVFGSSSVSSIEEDELIDGAAPVELVWELKVEANDDGVEEDEADDDIDDEDERGRGLREEASPGVPEEEGGGGGKVTIVTPEDTPGDGSGVRTVASIVDASVGEAAGTAGVDPTATTGENENEDSPARERMKRRRTLSVSRIIMIPRLKKKKNKGEEKTTERKETRRLQTRRGGRRRKHGAPAPPVLPPELLVDLGITAEVRATACGGWVVSYDEGSLPELPTPGEQKDAGSRNGRRRLRLQLRIRKRHRKPVAPASPVLPPEILMDLGIAAEVRATPSGGWVVSYNHGGRLLESIAAEERVADADDDLDETSGTTQN